jgi:hypothetical protein
MYLLDCSGSSRPFLLVSSSKEWKGHMEKQTATDWNHAIRAYKHEIWKQKYFDIYYKEFR